MDWSDEAKARLWNRGHRDHCHTEVEPCEECADIRAALGEIERLRSERVEHLGQIVSLQAKLAEAEGEVERLEGLILKVDDLCHERNHPLIVLSVEARRIRVQRGETYRSVSIEARREEGK